MDILVAPERAPLGLVLELRYERVAPRSIRHGLIDRILHISRRELLRRDLKDAIPCALGIVGLVPLRLTIAQVTTLLVPVSNVRLALSAVVELVIPFQLPAINAIEVRPARQECCLLRLQERRVRMGHAHGASRPAAC